MWITSTFLARVVNYYDGHYRRVGGIIGVSADYRCVGGIIGVSAELSAFRGNYRCVVVRKPCASSIEFAHVSVARSSNSNSIHGCRFEFIIAYAWMTTELLFTFGRSRGVQNGIRTFQNYKLRIRYN